MQKKPPEGTNVSRNIKEFLTERHYLSALSFLNGGKNLYDYHVINRNYL